MPINKGNQKDSIAKSECSNTDVTTPLTHDAYAIRGTVMNLSSLRNSILSFHYFFRWFIPTLWGWFELVEFRAAGWSSGAVVSRYTHALSGELIGGAFGGFARQMVLWSTHGLHQKNRDGIGNTAHICRHTGQRSARC
jgi:hypothetical protein